jgi:hypothetical protein
MYLPMLQSYANFKTISFVTLLKGCEGSHHHAVTGLYVTEC